MTPEREKELSRKIQSGEITDREKQEIEKEILQGNLRFVITIAKQ
jgi:DNA-directed RNA polymerase sigma subunit (sigma70/sigma32)